MGLNAVGEAPTPRRLDSSPENPPAAGTTPCGLWPAPYYLENGLRRVAPYHYTYKTWCKQRWRGRQLLEVFVSEFRDRTAAYYKEAMETGLVAVNGKKVGPDYVLKNGDLVSHTIHRHEPPVTAEPIRVLHEDDDLIVIDKPAGVPVHPAGRYSYNSLIEIMKAERGPGFVPFPCNRLDRLTSGIMFVGKNAKSAARLSIQIGERNVRKEYLARVIGKFPDGEVVCDQPVLVISPKLGLNRVRANGKAARTVFKRLAYYPPPEGSPDMTVSEDATISSEQRAAGGSRPWNGKKGYSIVRCLPVTGRTHQIRVHLQFLGHPIENDPIYANQKVWGFDLGPNDPDATLNSDEDIISRLSRMGKEEVADAVSYHDDMVDDYYKKRAERMSGEVCAVCQTPLYTDPGEQELSLWLHSLRYEDAAGDWTYVSPLPSWALPPVGMSGPTQVGGMDELIEAVRELDYESV
ncbi:pseudouridine synthase [Coniochaeta sp. PMI_546]|nr:pseudouridine synthase [Coniochaeta sp. PMI_546]